MWVSPMSVNLHLAFRLQNPTFTIWEIASGHLTANSLPAQIYLTWRQGEAGLSTLGPGRGVVGDSQPQHGQKLTYKKLTSVFKLASSLTLNNAENKMQADISAYLKGLLKTLNPKTLKSYNCPHSNWKNKSICFLLLWSSSLKKNKFIYILMSIIAVFFSPSIQGTLKTPVPFTANFWAKGNHVWERLFNSDSLMPEISFSCSERWSSEFIWTGS